MRNNIEEGLNLPSQLKMKEFLQEAWRMSGFKAPSLVQERTIPIILEGKDLIVESPTGTGKTLAYLLPLLNSIEEEKKGTQVVILAPSHELVMQIYHTVEEWTKGSNIISGAFIGSANLNRQLEALKKHPHIIVGTTGRVLELITLKKLKMHQVKTIVVDEFDVMIAQDHLEYLKSIIKTTLRDRQLLFFSATLAEGTEEIGKELMKEPQIISIKKEEYAPPKTQHVYIMCEEREKIDVLRKIVRSSEEIKALAFINDLNKIKEIADTLRYKSMDLGLLTGESTKLERQEAIKGFRRGKYQLLLATDIAARGLDIEGLTHVINWDLPMDSKQYTHRSGRTGRMGAAGTVISIVTNREVDILQRMTSRLDVILHSKELYKGELVDKKPSSPPKKSYISKNKDNAAHSKSSEKDSSQRKNTSKPKVQNSNSKSRKSGGQK